MKLIVCSFLLIAANVCWSHSDESLSMASGAKEAYTALEPGKSSSEMPSELTGVGIEEKIGSKLDLSTIVKNEKGESVPLSSFFKSHRPVMFSPVYFNCPGLCNFHLNGVVDTLKSVDWSAGNQFEVVAFSFDARETPADASKKKEMYMNTYNRPGTESGFHFVTSDAATIKKVTEQVGFKFKWNEKVSEWSHASAAIMISSDGTISRYLHGIQFEPRDVKLALNEAANGKVGNIADTVMLYCFKYDRHQSKYGLQTYRVMQLGGAITVLLLALWLIPVLIRAKREKN